MITAEVKKKIAEWAESEPNVIRAYIFGSRARGDFRPDSDLDVAVEIVKDSGDGNELGTWIGIGEELKERLSKLVTEHKIDLQWSHEHYSKIVHDGVESSSLLIYEEAE